jgi:hypothetical protein
MPILVACVGVPLIMLRGSVHDDWPLNAFHKSATRVYWMNPLFLVATASVQLIEPVQ